jgi:hypothetical protein
MAITHSYGWITIPKLSYTLCFVLQRRSSGNNKSTLWWILSMPIAVCFPSGILMPESALPAGFNMVSGCAYCWQETHDGSSDTEITKFLTFKEDSNLSIEEYSTWKYPSLWLSCGKQDGALSWWILSMPTVCQPSRGVAVQLSHLRGQHGNMQCLLHLEDVLSSSLSVLTVL